MITHQCPECGERIESPEQLRGQTETCPICGTAVIVASHKPLHKRMLSLLGEASVCVFAVFAYLGGLALWVWAIYLLYERWGIVSAIFAFLCPPFALVAVVGCFWWGMWFYVLAFGAWICSVVGYVVVQDIEWKPRWVAGAFVGLVLLAGAFGYFGWMHLVTPRPITPELRTELNDCAFAVHAILQSSVSGDPRDLTDLVEAKRKIRTGIKSHDSAAVDEICRTVNLLLAVEWSLHRDIIEYVSLLEQNPGAKFSMSARTMGLLDSLPQRLAVRIGKEPIIIDADHMTELLAPWARYPGDKSKAIKVYVNRTWSDHEAVYRDLLGRPMPAREQLAELTPDMEQ